MERRKDPKQRMTITQILDFMQNTADEQYQGDLQNNSLAIFNLLAPGDKKTFLRKSLMLQWEHQIDLAKGGLQDVIIDQELVIDRSSVNLERKSIESLNYAEQVKLKTWLWKVIFLIALLCFIGVVFLTYAMDGAEANHGEILKYLKDLFSLLV